MPCRSNNDAGRSFRTAVVATTAMLATACTVMEGTAIPRPEGDARLTVTVAPVLPAGNVSTNYVPSTFFQNAGALSGLPGLFIGVGLDVVVSSVRYSQHAWLRERSEE